MAAKRKLQARDPETGEVYTRTTAANYGVVRILVIPETWDSYDPTNPRRNRIVSWHRDESTATRYDAPSWRNLRHLWAPVTEPAVEYTVAPAPNAWTDLAPGALIEAVPSGTKADGTPITRPIRLRLDRDPWGYDPARGTYVVSDSASPVVVVADSVRVIESAPAGATAECPMDDPDCEAGYQLDPESYVCHDACEAPALAEPVMVVPSDEFTAYVTELGQRATDAVVAVTEADDALPARGHGKCDELIEEAQR